MGDATVPPKITAASLNAREEWHRRFPGADVLWEEMVDEGRGIGFDGLDPSAMARAMSRTSAGWMDVLAWYQNHLESLGWIGTQVKDTWWDWHHPTRPGEKFELLDRSYVPEALRPYAPPSTGQLFEVLFTARSSADPEPSTDA